MSPAAVTTLSSLTLGSLTLDPTFDSGTTTYTASTTDTSNKITAVATDEDAIVSIAVNGSAHENDTAATWETGENTVQITVTNESNSKVYTVTVTKS
ncbi:cadherin-like beta sandwich domain-containing protein [Orenia metallireducens]